MLALVLVEKHPKCSTMLERTNLISVMLVERLFIFTITLLSMMVLFLKNVGSPLSWHMCKPLQTGEWFEKDCMSEVWISRFLQHLFWYQSAMIAKCSRKYQTFALILISALPQKKGGKKISYQPYLYFIFLPFFFFFSHFLLPFFYPILNVSFSFFEDIQVSNPSIWSTLNLPQSFTLNLNPILT